MPLRAQVTLVREAPNDSFDLACAGCRTIVSNMAITIGQHAVPMNLQKPVSVNLLLWKYYDDILKKETLMAKEPFWTAGVQLLEEVPDTQMLSLHLNLIWEDSTGRPHKFFLVSAGFTKKSLQRLPVVCVFDPDTYSLLRFAAIAQIFKTDDDWETYDSIEGICTVNTFDSKTGSLSGTFEFTGTRIGMEKLGFFVNGRFQR